MVHNMVAGLQEFLQKDQASIYNLIVIAEPVDNVTNAVQRTQQQLAKIFQQMQAMMQTIQMKYAAAPQNTHQDYGGRGYHDGHNNFRCRGGRSAQHQVNWQDGRGGQGNSDFTYYCWNHIMCVHPVTDCRTPV